MRSRMLKSFLRYGHLPIREDDCSFVWRIPAEDRCDWVKFIDDCYSDSMFQYTAWLFCNFDSENALIFVSALFLIILWLFYLFLILGTTADQFFCPALAVLAAVMRLSDNIAGVTILAFGNGAPDIFTSVAAGEEARIIMFTELIGAGIFVTLIIAGTVTIIKPFQVSLGSLVRDISFYMFAVCWITYVVWDETVHLWEAASFILIYSLFIVVVVIFQIYDTREAKLKTRIPHISDPDVLHAYLQNRDHGIIPSIPIRDRPFGISPKIDIAIATEIERAKVRGEPIRVPSEISDFVSKRPKTLFREFLYDVNPINEEDWRTANILFKIILIVRSPFMLLLQLFIPVVNPIVEKRGWSKLLNCFQLCVTPMVLLLILSVWQVTISNVPLILIFFILGTVLGIIVFLVTRVDEVPKFHDLFAILGFFCGMLTIYLVAKEVMAVLRCVGHACMISDAMLGITFLAWGNSIGDIISNVTIAKQGFPRMGYAACFGGPMFNTLLGLGLSYGMAAFPDPEKLTIIRISNMAPGCLAFLLCSLLGSLLYLNITGAIARRSYGGLLYSIYIAFILIQILSEAQLIHPLGTDYRAD